MLNQSHIKFLPAGCRFVIGAEARVRSLPEAVDAINAGRVVAPAGPADARAIMDACGGDLIRRALIGRFGAEQMASATEANPISEPSAPPMQDADASADRVRNLVDAAGDDVLALRSLAAQYRVDVGERWGAKRIAIEINKAVSGRLAGGVTLGESGFRAVAANGDVQTSADGAVRTKREGGEA